MDFNLKGQKLDNQVSKTAKYSIKISDSFRQKLKDIRKSVHKVCINVILIKYSSSFIYFIPLKCIK